MSAECPFCGGNVTVEADCYRLVDGGDMVMHYYAACESYSCCAIGPTRIESEALTAFTQPAHALRAAIARAERAEALVREAGVMLKEREWDEPVCPDGYLEGMACSNCLTHEDNKHDPGCHYAAIITRIAELDYTELD